MSKKMRTKFILIILLSLLLLSLSHPAAWAQNATLTWTPPTTHVDGTPLTDLAGYKVYYGTASGTYTQVVDAGLTATPSTPTYTVINLVTGNTYYFAVTAYNTSGNESSYSNEVSKSFSVTTTTIPSTTSTTTTTIPGATSTTTVTVTTTSTTLDTTPPGDVQNFTAVAGDQQITLSWTDPPDLDYAGVRILYRTDRFPANINDGTLLGDFTGLPNENMSTTQTGLQNGVSYYYSASSYDSFGNFQSTVHASAIPSPSNGNLQQTIGGGCGMIFPKDGKPPGPGQAADMPALLAIMLTLLIKRRIQSLKFQVLYPLSPIGISVLSPLDQKKSFDRCSEVFAILKFLLQSGLMGNGKTMLRLMRKLGFFVTAGILGVLLLSLFHQAAWAGIAILAWNAPTTNVDGTSLTDLSGYKVYYGTESGMYTQVLDVGLTSTPGAPQYPVSNLTEGNTYCFAVTAYSSSRLESGLSNEVCKAIAPTIAGGGGGGQSAVSGGGGCGMIKDISNRSGQRPAQIALDLAMLVLPFILVKMKRLLKVRRSIFGTLVLLCALLGTAGIASAAGGINVEPSYRPWRYLGGPNPDGWWCVPPNCYENPDPISMINTELALAKELHVTNIRLEFPWTFIEPSKGVFNWSRADAIMSAANSAGIEIQAILVFSPSWAASTPTDPPSATDFSAFVTAIVNRYKASIHYWEMWNEPDLSRYWNSDEATYVSNILIPGYQAVKAADPAAKVIIGGPSNPTTTWYNAIYSNGGGNSFDIAAFHNYCGALSCILSNASTIQSVLNANGQGNKPIWMGEYGLQENSIQDTQQQSLMTAVLTNTSLIAFTQWYNLRDDYSMYCCPPAPVDVISNYGLVQHDDITKKNGFSTMQTLLGGAPPSPPTGVVVK